MAVFTAELEVVEPMGMEALIYFPLEDLHLCDRVAPEVATGPGQPMRLMADMNHMHLADPESEQAV